MALERETRVCEIDDKWGLAPTRSCVGEACRRSDHSPARRSRPYAKAVEALSLYWRTYCASLSGLLSPRPLGNEVIEPPLPSSLLLQNTIWSEIGRSVLVVCLSILLTILRLTRDGNSQATSTSGATSTLLWPKTDVMHNISLSKWPPTESPPGPRMNVCADVEYHSSRNTFIEVSNVVLMRVLTARCIQLSVYVHILGVMCTKIEPKAYT